MAGFTRGKHAGELQLLRENTQRPSNRQQYDEALPCHSTPSGEGMSSPSLLERGKHDSSPAAQMTHPQPVRRYSMAASYPAPISNRRHAPTLTTPTRYSLTLNLSLMSSLVLRDGPGGGWGGGSKVDAMIVIGRGWQL